MSKADLFLKTLGGELISQAECATVSQRLHINAYENECK